MSSTGKRVGDDSIIKTFFESYDYQDDPEYMEWEEQLYDENNKFTFEKTVSFCENTKIWRFNGDWKEKTKEKWLKYIQEWNMIRYEKEKIDPTENSIVGYAAITYLYVVLPYDQLQKFSERCVFVSEFQAKLINICMLHETGQTLDCFKDYDQLTLSDPPHDVIEFENYLHEQYNSAGWFLTFLIFLSKKGIELEHKGATWSLP